MRSQPWLWLVVLAAHSACSTEAKEDVHRLRTPDEDADSGGDVAPSDEPSSADGASHDAVTGSDSPLTHNTEFSDLDVEDNTPSDNTPSDDSAPSGEDSSLAPSDSAGGDSADVTRDATTLVGDDETVPIDDSELVPEDSGAPEVTTPRVPVNHRAVSEACDNVRPPGSGVVPEEVDAGPLSEYAECHADEDCAEGANGRCAIQRDGFFCSYDRCFEDLECSNGPCSCGLGTWSDANQCMGGNCQVDTDCGAGGYCSPTFSDCGQYLGVVGYWCHTPNDICIDDADCTDPDQGAGYCAFSEEVGYWSCSYSECVG